MAIHPPELRPFAQLPSDIKAYAAENGLDASALDDIHYRDYLNDAICARIPVERLNNRWKYRPANVPRIAAYYGVVAPKAAA